MSVNVNIVNDKPSEKTQVKILFIDLTHQNQTVQFLTCCVAVFIFFLLYGYMQELIFTIDGFQPYGWYLTLVQFGCYTIFGLIEKFLNNIQSRKYVRFYLYLTLH